VVNEVGALGKHIALVGFMGAGKTTIGRKVARLTERPFIDLDEEIEKRHGSIPKVFRERGEAEFRRIEEELAREFLRERELNVIALGGGAVTSEATRGELRRHAFTVWIDVDLDHAWARVCESDRPLARDRDAFAALHRERAPLYSETADARASDADDVVLRALQIVFAPGRLGSPLSLGERPIALVVDEHVARRHPLRLEGVASTHHLPPGEAAKRIDVVASLWSELRIGRDGMVVGFGGGTTTDVAGFAAGTYLRGVPWTALPTTLVGQVDASIGGKTGVDLADAKNLVGAFHYPLSVQIDTALLATLPEHERRNGMAEVVKTGLLAGRPVWDLPEERMVRACAAFKAAVCLSDPYDRIGRRSILNLGHTFGHALEAASDYTLAHGEAVALGLLAALRLSAIETDVVDEVLRPEPARVDPERAWHAMQRDKKAQGGRIRLVLLEAPGKPIFPVELADEQIRLELDRLIAK
jgi:shikimate kinase / 3-dehydroquinate synthase